MKMKNFLQILSVTLAGLLVSGSLYAQIPLPQPSSSGKVVATVGLTEISIEYFRPKKKGRNIFGEGSDFLVPYGQIWRTGANSGSKISFEDAVTIQGKTVEAGEYLIFTKPGADSWEVMLYSDLSLGGNVTGYDPAKEVGKFNVKPSKLTETVETMTFNVSDISEDNTSANIELTWENTSVKLPVTVDFDSKVMEAIKANTTVNPNNYIAAANYYFSTGKDLNQALKWMNTALEASESPAFWTLHTKAQIQKELGDFEGARETATKSLELAKASGNDFGYVKRNEDLLAELPKSKGKKGRK